MITEIPKIGLILFFCAVSRFWFEAQLCWFPPKTDARVGCRSVFGGTFGIEAGFALFWN